jgi:hypothetical protein
LRAPLNNEPVAVREPLSRGQLRRSGRAIGGVIPFIGALVYASRRSHLTASSEIILLAGFVSILFGGILDARYRRQERVGTGRFLPLFLLGAGLFAAIAVLATTTPTA